MKYFVLNDIAYVLSRNFPHYTVVHEILLFQYCSHESGSISGCAQWDTVGTNGPQVNLKEDAIW